MGLRAFVALDLPEEVAGALDRLQAEIPAGRIVPAGNLHLTLAFMADVERPVLDDLALSLEMLGAAPLALTITGLDMFGADPPRVLYAAIDGGEPLRRLRAKVVQAARDAGAELPHSRFVPHVTLARLGAGTGADGLARLGRFLSARGDFRVSDFVPPSLTLYRSTMTPDGPRYDPLAEHAFVGV